jgi:DNA polymerase-2
MAQKSLSVYNCFLINHFCRDTGNRLEITLYARSSCNQTIKIIINDFLPPFFVPSNTSAELTGRAFKRKSVNLLNLDSVPVDCCYFRTLAGLKQCAAELRAAGIKPHESDIHPTERFLMERIVRGSFTAEGPARKDFKYIEMINPKIRGGSCEVKFKVLSLDIETNVATGEIYCIGCFCETGTVFMTSATEQNNAFTSCADEKNLLVKFIEHISSQDPDIIIGWNVIDFDLTVIQERCAHHGIAFDIGRSPNSRITEPSGESGHRSARIPGRIVMDVPVMLRAFNHTFEEYSLDYVSTVMLGRKKEITLSGQSKIDEIDRQYRYDKPSLASYNISDTVLTCQIFEKAGLLANTIERAKLCGHLLDRTGGSVAAFDYLYLPALHRAGYVANDLADAPVPPGPLPGGYVMESDPGIYENILLFDFKSLYPTIIMTFLIDPLGAAVKDGRRIKGPEGPSFSIDKSILPGIITHLLSARIEARKTGNASLSQAIKILMNSFYGVLGTTGCRFFSYDLASTITKTGQYLLRATRDHIEKTSGFSIIYGDTDSLFVLLGPGMEKTAGETGRAIVSETNSWLAGFLKENFNAESALELEFEMHFRHFFMPTIRGSQQGSKKRYCGTEETANGLKLHFKGLESARSDWTQLAKNFQHELFMKIFKNMPVENYISEITGRIRNGSLDKELVYRKGVRKKLEEYTEHVPPHIQAARMLGGKAPSRISYVITVEGPQPLEKISAPLDYEHYIETQIRPIAESILEWKGIRFEDIITGQQDLFK